MKSDLPYLIDTSQGLTQNHVFNESYFTAHSHCLERDANDLGTLTGTREKTFHSLLKQFRVMLLIKVTYFIICEVDHKIK